MLLFYSSSFFLKQKKQNFCVFYAEKKEVSGNAVVQVWNGELGGWMVVGRSTGLLDNF